MIIKIDSVSLLSVRPKDYNGKKYYFASIFDNGYVSSVSCTEDFYKNHVSELKGRTGDNLLTIKSVPAELYFFKGQAKIKLL